MLVGIGASSDPGGVIAALPRLPAGISVVLYLPRGLPLPPLPDNTRADPGDFPAERMIADLAAGRIDAAVRGTLPANSTLTALKKVFSVERLERVAVLETADGRRFLFAPVGIDEGWTVHDKCRLIEGARRLAERLSADTAVAVLSGGRFGDVGRHERVDRSLADAELVARLASADHAEILIEDAVADHGIIIAPDGISGNLIFRTLVFLGRGIAHGAPVLNIDKIFVDTSRASLDYSNAIKLAAALAKKN